MHVSMCHSRVVSMPLMFYFQVLSRDEVSAIGKISRQWPGLARAFFTDADIFGVTCTLGFLLSVLRKYGMRGIHRLTYMQFCNSIACLHMLIVLTIYLHHFIKHT